MADPSVLLGWLRRVAEDPEAKIMSEESMRGQRIRP